MQKQAPSFGRLLTMALFALSCFGLLLFLWLSFGGTVPLKPQGYRFQVAFPEATQLGLEADVRIAGVSVGKVRAKDLVANQNRTLATIELEPKYAPLPADSRAILRQKTLLGETYVELTPGNKNGPKVPDNGRLANGRVQSAVELDEIFQALDPKTRQAFRIWQQELAKGVVGRGRDLNDALGNLPTFAHDAADVLAVLDTQQRATQQLVKNTGNVFAALTQNEQALHALIVNAGNTFDATASQDDALADAIQVFPTFLDESKTTLARLQKFSTDTAPLMKDLVPAGHDLAPTLHDVRLLAPDLARLFRAMGPLITVSKDGLPALKNILTETKPLLGNLGGFLGQLNPILQWLEMNQGNVADFITNGSAALEDTTVSRSGGVGHYLRQFGPVGLEALGFYPQRLPNNRGNSYIGPNGLDPKFNAEKLIFPNFDCNNAGGETDANLTSPVPQMRTPACYVAPPVDFQGKRQGRFTHVGANDYSKPRG